MNQIIDNFSEIFKREDLFSHATETEISQLKKLFGEKVNKVIEFYCKYQPNNFPMSKSYVQLIDIDKIIIENTIGEPGKFMAEYGVYVFALTVGGNVLCIDTNDVHDGDANVLIADSNFCSYNETHNCVEIGVAPEEVVQHLGEGEILVLNYANMTKCLKKIENSFLTFMLKLSKNEYDDIEAYLE
ncbi:MAG: hypothetical protein Q4F28_03215 [Eubacteriales bacterium]|nr:hypothetical protein [Eubacteriales bacterium]